MKHIRYYAVFWVALIILLNIICFITPSYFFGISKYSGGFWACYGFVTVAFILHFIYAYFALSEKSPKKREINNSLIVISFIELAIMVAVSAWCMTAPTIPYWMGVIACYAVLAFSVIFLMSAKVVEENAYNANIALNAKTSTMRDLTDKAQELVMESSTPEIKGMLTKVADAIRYSDPVSSESTQIDEMNISEGLDELKRMVQSNDDIETIRHKAEELLILIEKRNNKCKALKRRV